MKIFKKIVSIFKDKRKNIIQMFNKNFNEILYENNIYDSFDRTVTPYNIEIIDSNGAFGVKANLKFPNGLSIKNLDKCMDCFRETLIGKCMVMIEDNYTNITLTAVNKWFDIPFVDIKVPSPLHVFIGYDINVKPIILDFSKFPHMLVTGASGSGKSKFIEVMISNMAKQWSEDELELYFLQVAKGDQFKYELLKHCKGCVTSSSRTRDKNSLDLALDLLEYLYKQLEDREDLVLSCIKRRDEDINLNIYNKKNPVKRISPMFILIDEASSLFEIDNSMSKEEKALRARACKICMEIAKRGRYVGVNLIIAQQRATKDELPRAIKVNCNNLVTFRQNDKSASQVAIGDEQAALGLLPQVYVYKSGTDKILYGKTPQSNWTSNVKMLSKDLKIRRDNNKQIQENYKEWLNDDNKKDEDYDSNIKKEIDDFRVQLGDFSYQNSKQQKDYLSNNASSTKEMIIDDIKIKI